MWLRDLASTAVPAWVVARVLTLGAFATAVFIVDDQGPLRHASKATVRSGLLSWDAAYYADIARHGYTARVELRFFPLVPLVRGVRVRRSEPANRARRVQQHRSIGRGLAVVSPRAFEMGDTALGAPGDVAPRALPPAAFVFVMGYADCHCDCARIAAFLARPPAAQWLPTFGLALAAGLAQPAGFLLAVPIAIEAARDLRACRPRERAQRAAAVLGAPLGTAIFLLWVGSRFDDALLPYRVQTRADLKDPFRSPVTTISHAVRGLLHGDAVGTRSPRSLVVARRHALGRVRPALADAANRARGCSS